MPTYQSYNKKINAWVKYHFGKDGAEFKDVKEREPKKPFKGIPKKGKKKKKKRMLSKPKAKMPSIDPAKTISAGGEKKLVREGRMGYFHPEEMEDRIKWI